MQLLLVLMALLLGACSSIMRSAQQGLATQLEAGILDHDDPETVAAGLPAYLVLIDGAISKNPSDPQLLCTGAQLYGAFAGSLVSPGERALRLSHRALKYARRAACAAKSKLCDIEQAEFESIVVTLGTLSEKDQPQLSCLAQAWAGLIQANSEDWNAIADIPKVKAMFEHLERSSKLSDGTTELYLGVLNALLPKAYGGQPESSKAFFERAIERSDGRNLMAKVLYAERYARLVFDKDLHDKLLGEVLSAPAEAPKLTLINTLAKAKAQQLLESGKDYF